MRQFPPPDEATPHRCDDRVGSHHGGELICDHLVVQDEHKLSRAKGFSDRFSRPTAYRLASSRQRAWWPPRYAFLANRALPSAVRGPVDCSHGRITDRTLRNPNKDGRFSRKSRPTRNFAFSDSFVRFRPFASVLGFCQRNDTHNDTRHEGLPGLSPRKSGERVGEWSPANVGRLESRRPSRGTTVPISRRS